MKYRLRDVIDSLDYNEMVKMKKDLEAGGFHLKAFLDHKIKEQEKEHASFCTTCGNSLEKQSSNNFTLIWGPDDFKKKASFCGMDCLNHFLSELKTIKETR
jgi:hypothetical protein